MKLREKAEKYGVETLIPHENISLITGIELNAIKDYKTLDSIFSSIDIIKCTTLQRNKLKALYKLYIEASKEHSSKYKVSNPWDIYKFYMNELRHEKREIFKIVCLDTKNQIIKDEVISIGTLNASLVHPREVFNKAILNNSNSVILLHNHPSGSVEPSTEDKNTTKRLIKCGELLGIAVTDHIIIGDGLYYSFKENLLL